MNTPSEIALEDLSFQADILIPELNVIVDASAASNHNARPAIPAGLNAATGALATTGAGGVTPLITTAHVVGDAKAPTCDVRITAPNPGLATTTPPDLDDLAATPPEGTYCAAALTKEVKSDPD